MEEMESYLPSSEEMMLESSAVGSGAPTAAGEEDARSVAVCSMDGVVEAAASAAGGGVWTCAGAADCAGASGVVVGGSGFFEP